MGAAEKTAQGETLQTESEQKKKKEKKTPNLKRLTANDIENELSLL